MDNERNKKRDICFIRVLVEGHAGQVRDITLNGFKVTLLDNVDFKTGEVKDFLLIPDDSLKLSNLTVKGRIRWIKKDSIYNIFGVDLSDFTNNNILLNEIVAKWTGE